MYSGWVVVMAGKARRQRERKLRRSKKIARKLAQKALYEQWMREGRNTKSKRVKLRTKQLRKTKLRTRKHAGGPCGNIGCKLCNPIPQNLVTPTHAHIH